MEKYEGGGKMKQRQMQNINLNKGATHAKFDVLAKYIDQPSSQIYFRRKVLTKVAFLQVFRNKQSALMLLNFSKLLLYLNNEPEWKHNKNTQFN